MRDAIIIKNLTKAYQIPSIFPWKHSKKIQALKNISLSCPREKITCLLGPNGAGKTTIIKILAGLIMSDSGSIEINNSFLTNKEKNNSRIGFVTQNDRSFYWRLTGRQNLDFYGSLYNLKGQRKKQKISEVLSEINMEKEADKPFRLYSSGMRQKLHIARALLCDPDILLLDEPTSHIDPLAQENIYKLIKEKFLSVRKTTVLLCTHNLNEAQFLSHKIILLDNGSVIADGEINSLRSKISSNVRVTIEFAKMPEKEWEKGLRAKVLNNNNKSIELGLEDEKIIPGIISAAVSNGGEIVECKKAEESLLEIFTRLTAENHR